MKKGKFIVTVDTEGDNLWNRATTKDGIRPITVENAKYIGRFQALCQKYDFIPTYLVDYEMIMSDEFVNNAKQWQKQGLCEIGMHMHAWNCPPIHQLPFYAKGHNPYAGEYPQEVLWKKLKYLTELIEKRVGVRPTSHRGGRWYIDDWYVERLIELGYTSDCTITPGISWRSTIGNKMYGPDYSGYKDDVFYLDKDRRLLEIPPTIIPTSLLHRIKEILKKPYDTNEIWKKKIWLRPNGNNVDEMLYIANKRKRTSYLEFMIHSSELMPGGSPLFATEKSIDKLYQNINTVFEIIAKFYDGITLSEYAECRNGKR